MGSMIRYLFWKAFGVLAAVLPIAASAQGTYPQYPVKIVVGSSAGSSIDMLARVYAEFLGAQLGQPTIVENRSGANGDIGTGIVARSKPDGLTLLMLANNGLINQQAGRSKFDVMASFEPIALAGRAPWVMSVSAESPFRSIKDVVEFGKRNPDQLNFAGLGGGSIPDFMGKALADSAGIDILPIPYPSTSDARADVLTGRVALWFTTMSVALPMHQAGRLRILGVAGENQPDALKDVPSMKRAGYESMDIESTYFFLAPTGTPQGIIDRLNTEINRAQRDPGVVEKLKLQGVYANGGSVSDTVSLIRDELTRWGKAIQSSKAK